MKGKKGHFWYGMAIVDDNLFVIGGCTARGEKMYAIGKTECYNAKTKKWMLKSPLIIKRW